MSDNPNPTALAGIPARRPYAAPSLKIYGTVETLTRGIGGSRNAVADVGGGFNTASGSIPSDRTIKQDIVRVGTHPLGIGLYLFTYKPQFRDACGHGRRFGVMADEVAQVLPAAVGTHAMGHQTVDYAMLGIRLH